ANPWRLTLQQPAMVPQRLPAGTRITQVYDNAGGELLILGEPGSGKTTLLLTLARDLLERAEQDESHPMPVVFNLSSWATRQQPITDWLVEELNSKYQVRRKLAQGWVDSEQILPLLDGFDEVTPAARIACLNAINTYRQEHGLLPTVVCSRSTEYLNLTTQLQLDSAVEVQPLTEQQVNDYLASGGEPLWALRVALHRDPMLRELTNTPLMLSILTLTYHGMPVEDLLKAASPTDRQRQIFERYTERMLQRRSADMHYTHQQTMHWLSWLAKRLVQHGQTVFYIERMQPDWLPDHWSRWLYHAIAVGPIDALLGMLVGTLIGIVYIYYYNISALAYGLVGLLISVLIRVRGTGIQPESIVTRSWQRFANIASLRDGTIIGLVIGPAIGLLDEKLNGASSIGLKDVLVNAVTGALVGLLVGTLIRARQTDIQPLEIVTWSLRRFFKLKHLRNGVLVGLGIGLINLLFFYPRYALTYGLLGATVSWLFSGLVDVLSSDTLDDHSRITPNQGIRHSARNSILIGLIIGLATGLTVGLCIGVVYWLFQGPVVGLAKGEVDGIAYALGIGLVSGLLGGGDAYSKHVVLRLLLRGTGCLPWNYPRFLDYAAECILLRKVGGGYIFTHRLLLEYFATLDARPTPSMAATQRQKAPPRICACGHLEDRIESKFCPNCGKPMI
ncbi:MAG: NACHT domain-containing protein, partial [Chloroflexi bacterium]|nr:NACHT domain-containing protein [Chloroflexota bacterium]